jgi:hypothetical protein
MKTTAENRKWKAETGRAAALAGRKLRGGGASELTRLKSIWLALAESAHEGWRQRFCGAETPQVLRQALRQQLGVNLTWDRQLIDFRQWDEANQQRMLMGEKIEERKQELLAGGMTLEAAQDVLLTEASAYSVAARDFKLGLKVSGEISRTSANRLEQEKFKETLRTKIQAGLEALLAEARGHPAIAAAVKQIQEATE